MNENGSHDACVLVLDGGVGRYDTAKSQRIQLDVNNSFCSYIGIVHHSGRTGTSFSILLELFLIT